MAIIVETAKAHIESLNAKISLLEGQLCNGVSLSNLGENNSLALTKKARPPKFVCPYSSDMRTPCCTLCSAGEDCPLAKKEREMKLDLSIDGACRSNCEHCNKGVCYDIPPVLPTATNAATITASTSTNPKATCLPDQIGNVLASAQISTNVTQFDCNQPSSTPYGPCTESSSGPCIPYYNSMCYACNVKPNEPCCKAATESSGAEHKTASQQPEGQNTLPSPAPSSPSEEISLDLLQKENSVLKEQILALQSKVKHRLFFLKS